MRGTETRPAEREAGICREAGHRAAGRWLEDNHVAGQTKNAGSREGADCFPVSVTASLWSCQPAAPSITLDLHGGAGEDS